MHTYIHTYIHTYMHAYIHTYVQGVYQLEKILMTVFLSSQAVKRMRTLRQFVHSTLHPLYPLSSQLCVTGFLFRQSVTPARQIMPPPSPPRLFISSLTRTHHWTLSQATKPHPLFIQDTFPYFPPMTFSLLHIRYVPHSSHPLLLIMLKQVVSTNYGQLLTTHFSPASRLFLCLRSKYFSRDPQTL
jgi:hypothetical protein